MYKAARVSTTLTLRSKTRTAGSIIRVVIDELDAEDENDADHDCLVVKAKSMKRGMLVKNVSSILSSLIFCILTSILTLHQSNCTM